MKGKFKLKPGGNVIDGHNLGDANLHFAGRLAVFNSRESVVPKGICSAHFMLIDGRKRASALLSRERRRRGRSPIWQQSATVGLGIGRSGLEIVSRSNT